MIKFKGNKAVCDGVTYIAVERFGDCNKCDLRAVCELEDFSSGPRCTDTIGNTKVFKEAITYSHTATFNGVTYVPVNTNERPNPCSVCELLHVCDNDVCPLEYGTVWGVVK